ncbi:MAG: FGGY family carbohydrate kinase, partial [Endozoicomonas sp.]
MQPVLLSIDVGTDTLRSALVDLDGQILACNDEPLLAWKTALTLEFSSDNIWQAMTHSINRLLRENPIAPAQIQSIGLDATYSMVLLGEDMTPVPLPQNPKANILGWMDHRSARQASYIADMHPGLLNGAGSQVTPETNLCKLLWLYQEAPDTWKQTHHLMDLCDFLTWKCTGFMTLSPSSTGSGIPAVEFAQLGIDIQDRLAGERVPFSSAVASGLTPDSAEQLGLKSGTPVATGMIDSLGGTLATIMARHRNDRSEDTPVDITRRLSMIGGTSSVYMAFHQQAIKAHGIGGPFPSPLTGYYMNFVRQTAGGALIDHVLTSHPAFTEAQNSAISLGISVYEFLHQLLTKMAAGHCSISELTQDLHVLPYFAGNHCPRVDMSLQGMITGLTLDKSQESLARIYLAALQALAL